VRRQLDHVLYNAPLFALRFGHHQAGIVRVVAPRPCQEQLDTSRWRASWTHARLAFTEAGINLFEYEGEMPCD